MATGCSGFVRMILPPARFDRPLFIGKCLTKEASIGNAPSDVGEVPDYGQISFQKRYDPQEESNAKPINCCVVYPIEVDSATGSHKDVD